MLVDESDWVFAVFDDIVGVPDESDGEECCEEGE